jgi:ribosomal protein S18 acetylase RimI-like enzyme
MRNRKPNNDHVSILKYVFISVLMFVIAIGISIITRMCLVSDMKFSSFTDNQASLISSMIEGAVGAVAAGFVLYQLKIGAIVEEHENDIAEAQFILQYNQAFIQDPNMCQVEHDLEQQMLGAGKDVPMITDENQQLFINYLVYLEGLAPLVFRNVLHLEHIDDLMAYRFFLAVNNPELQKDQLFEFPEYYRGCLKLYTEWKRYRKAHGQSILQEDSSLDKWLDYERYIDSSVVIRKPCCSDESAEIAELIYGTDPFIYPAAFGSVKNAKKILPDFMQKQDNIFAYENLRIAVADGHIAGVSVVLEHAPDSEMDTAGLIAQYPSLPKSFRHANQMYFGTLPKYFESSENCVYILCLSVSPKYRGNRIGEMLLKNTIKQYPNQNILLHVLSDNGIAVSLYKKYGFQFNGDEQPGYAYSGSAPKCHEMLRRPD